MLTCIECSLLDQAARVLEFALTSCKGRVDSAPDEETAIQAVQQEVKTRLLLAQVLEGVCVCVCVCVWVWFRCLHQSTYNGRVFSYRQLLESLTRWRQNSRLPLPHR